MSQRQRLEQERLKSLVESIQKNTQTEIPQQNERLSPRTEENWDGVPYHIETEYLIASQDRRILRIQYLALVAIFNSLIALGVGLLGYYLLLLRIA